MSSLTSRTVESAARARNGFERVEPLRLAYASARAKARLGHRMRRRKLRVDTELVEALCLGPDQVERLALRAAELEASDLLERRLFRRLDTGEIGSLLRVEGLENLDAALAKGRGAVLYSLHLWGKYTFFAALAGAGYPPTPVAVKPEPARLQWMSTLEDKFGYTHIWLDAGSFGAAVEAANVLRRNGIVVMMIDWPTTRMSEVDFLGRRARLASGAVAVAQSMRAPLLDYYLYRRDGRWTPQVAEIGVPFTPSNGEGALQECADRLAAHVRRDPAQWTFFYNHPHSAFAGTAQA